jgi:hypothetical protein
VVACDLEKEVLPPCPRSGVLEKRRGLFGCWQHTSWGLSTTQRLGRRQNKTSEIRGVLGLPHEGGTVCGEGWFGLRCAMAMDLGELSSSRRALSRWFQWWPESSLTLNYVTSIFSFSLDDRHQQATPEYDIQFTITSVSITSAFSPSQLHHCRLTHFRIYFVDNKFEKKLNYN